MDKPKGAQQGANEDDERQRLFPPGFFEIFGQTYEDYKREHYQNIGSQQQCEISDQSDQSRKNSFYQRWWGHIPIDRRIELLLTAAIAFFACVQVAITVANNMSTSAQVDKIIGAADSIKASAYQFSGAAQGINNAGWNAVGKLQGQVDQIKVANGLTDKALETSKQQFALENRPYLWQMSAIGTNNTNIHPSFGKKEGDPQMTVRMDYQNFGHLPATVTRITGDVALGGENGNLRPLSAHHWMNYLSVVPPGRVDSIEVPSQEKIPAHSIAIPNPNGRIGVLFRIQYKDVGGHLFESDMCMWYPLGLNQQPEYCPAEFNLTRIIDCQQEACEK